LILLLHISLRLYFLSACYICFLPPQFSYFLHLSSFYIFFFFSLPFSFVLFSFHSILLWPLAFMFSFSPSNFVWTMLRQIYCF
jgi:hypothetical protein